MAVNGSVVKSLFALLLSVGVIKQSVAIEAAKVEDRNSVRWGGVDWIPEWRSEYGYDTNVFSRSDNEVSSRTWGNTFILEGLAQSGAQDYSLLMTADHVRYDEESSVNYTDWGLQLEADLSLNRRNFVVLNASYDRVNEIAGTGYSEGDTTGNTDSDVSDQVAWGVDYRFGSENAKGRIDLAYRNSATEYRNDRSATRARDVENDIYTGRFTYRRSDVSAFSIALVETRIRYPNVDTTGPDINVESDETQLLLGSRFNLSNKLRFDGEAGYARRDFIDSSETESIPAWNVQVSWGPRERMELQLGTSNTFQESSGTGNYEKSQTWTLAWSHDWNERFSSELSVDYQEDEINDVVVGSLREDESSTLALDLTYEFRRWLNFGFEVSTTERDSDADAFNYDRQIYLLYLNAHL